MNHPPLTLLVLAAGIGSRYGGLKQIEPIGPHGETVLDYSVHDAIRAGFTEAVFVIRRDLQDLFQDRISRRFEARIAVKFVHQEIDRLPDGRQPPPGRTKPWGTGHAVWCATGAITQPFAVVNADDFYGRDSFAQLATCLRSLEADPKPQPACLVGFQLANTLSEHGTVSRGVCRLDESSRLLSVEECTAIGREAGRLMQQERDGTPREFTGHEIVSMNCWGFLPGIFPLLDRRLGRFLDERGHDPLAEFLLPTAITDMIAKQDLSVQVLRTDASWFGVTYRDDHPLVVNRLQRLIGQRQYPARLWHCPSDHPETGF
jgi:hypothetical protein